MEAPRYLAVCLYRCYVPLAAKRKPVRETDEVTARRVSEQINSALFCFGCVAASGCRLPACLGAERAAQIPDGQ